MFAEDYNCFSFFKEKMVLYTGTVPVFYKNIFVKTNIRPDIRYPANTVSGASLNI
jgi:hypothetical protein